MKLKWPVKHHKILIETSEEGVQHLGYVWLLVWLSRTRWPSVLLAWFWTFAMVLAVMEPRADPAVVLRPVSWFGATNKPRRGSSDGSAIPRASVYMQTLNSYHELKSSNTGMNTGLFWFWWGPTKRGDHARRNTELGRPVMSLLWPMDACTLKRPITPTDEESAWRARQDKGSCAPGHCPSCGMRPPPPPPQHEASLLQLKLEDGQNQTQAAQKTELDMDTAMLRVARTTSTESDTGNVPKALAKTSSIFILVEIEIRNSNGPGEIGIDIGIGSSFGLRYSDVICGVLWCSD